MSVQSHLRPNDLLSTLCDTVRANRTADSTHPELAEWLPHADGELAALEWALGHRELSPLSSTVSVDLPDSAALDRERWIGVEMLHGQAPMDGRGRKYVSGVEATLMWILGKTDSEPF